MADRKKKKNAKVNKPGKKLGVSGKQDISTAGQSKNPEKKGDRMPNGDFAKGTSIGKQYRWKPGNTGNAAGRSTGPNLMTIFSKLLEEPIKLADGTIAKMADGTPMNKARLLMESAFKHAIKGDKDFFRELLNRYAGRVPAIVHANITHTPFEELTDEDLDKIIAQGEAAINDDNDGDNEQGNAPQGEGSESEA